MRLPLSQLNRILCEDRRESKQEALISRFLLWRIVLVSVLFTIGIFAAFQWALANGYSENYARTFAVNTLVAMEVWYLFSVRYLRQGSLFKEGIKGTKAVLIAVSLVFLLQLAFTYLPVLQRLFQTESFTIGSWCSNGSDRYRSFLIAGT